uniref:Uncharacterized protein n=1 Tax=Molossus molossus TaxID=27622 RepID=A0A7J8CS03_MOLMO|nr:hypothetical protein HJG59_009796 [Molossus molossus]
MRLRTFASPTADFQRRKAEKSANRQRKSQSHRSHLDRNAVSRDAPFAKTGAKVKNCCLEDVSGAGGWPCTALLERNDNEGLLCRQALCSGLRRLCWRYLCTMSSAPRAVDRKKVLWPQKSIASH